MANNYMQSSAFLNVPEDQLEQARTICQRIQDELENDDEDWGFCGVEWQVMKEGTQKGVWFSGDESINVDHLEDMARAVIEELKIDEPFHASWSYTCSKPRVDEFGGGAMAIVRGHPTVYIDAMSEVERLSKGLTAKDSEDEVLDDAMKKGPAPEVGGPTP